MSEIGGHIIACRLGTLRELTLLLRADHQLLQAVPGRQLRPHHRGVGPGQPDVCPAPGRPRAVAAGRVPGARRRREPVPGHLRPGGGGAHRGRAGHAAGRRRSPATCTPPTPRCRPPWTRPRCCGRKPGWRPRRSVPRWWALRQHGRVELDSYHAAVTDWEPAPLLRTAVRARAATRLPGPGVPVITGWNGAAWATRTTAVSPGPGAASGGHPAVRGRRRQLVAVDVDVAAGGKAAAEAGGLFVAADVTVRNEVAHVFAAAFAACGWSTSRSTTPASRRPRTTRSYHRPGRVAPGPGGQPHLACTCAARRRCRT